MIEIKCRFTERVLFSHDGDNLKIAVEAAVSAGANLARAYLAGANLAGANLAGANLDGANLDGANLARAYLDGAYLAGANLVCANLVCAYLDGAYLAGANLDGAKLVCANLAGANLAGANLDGANLDGANLASANLDGANLDGGKVASGSRPALQIGPIGSRRAHLIAWITRNGAFIRTGCFWGTRDQFAEKVAETHGDNVHAQEYAAALALIDAHARLWAPAQAEAKGG